MAFQTTSKVMAVQNLLTAVGRFTVGRWRRHGGRAVARDQSS
ncbi:MAG: hypothetical protein ACOYM4_01215 [Nodosilinea sp.]